MTLENWISIVGVIVSLIAGLIPTIFQYKENKAKKQKRYELTKQYDIEQKRLQEIINETSQANKNSNYNNITITNSSGSVVQINNSITESSINNEILQQQNKLDYIKSEKATLSRSPESKPMAGKQSYVLMAFAITLAIPICLAALNHPIDLFKLTFSLFHSILVFNIILILFTAIRVYVFVNRNIKEFTAWLILAILQVCFYFLPDQLYDIQLFHIISSWYVFPICFTAISVLGFCIFFLSNLYYNGTLKKNYLKTPYVMYGFSIFATILILLFQQFTPKI